MRFVRKPHVYGVLLVLLSSCSDSPEVFVRVNAPDVSDKLDRLQVQIHRDDASLAVAEVSYSDFGTLPQSFVVKVGPDSAGGQIRLNLRGFGSGNISTSADSVFALPESGRAEAELILTDTCSQVYCPRMQFCAAVTNSCNDACFSDAACAELIGCREDSVCTDAVAGSALGSCAGEAADTDSDGSADSRCPFAATAGDQQSGDCDDTSAAAKPGANQRCGDSRDHDCDGVRDEAQLCTSSCLPTSSIATGTEETYQLSFTATSIGGYRVDGSVERFVVGSSTGIFSLQTDGDSISTVDQIDSSRVNQLIWVGPTVVAATDEGLLWASIDAEGALTQAHTPLGFPQHAPAPLTAVITVNQLVYASGQGIGLVALDISLPQAPRVLAAVAGPAASSLVVADDRVIAAVEGTLLQYPLDSAGVPSESSELSGLIAEGETVTTMDFQPGRDSSEDFILSLGIANDGGGSLKVFERSGTSFAERASLGGLASLAGVFTDAGVVMYTTVNGAVGVVLRDTGPGVLTNSSAVSPASGGSASAFYGTTRNDLPVAVIARGNQLAVVAFTCQ